MLMIMTAIKEPTAKKMTVAANSAMAFGFSTGFTFGGGSKNLNVTQHFTLSGEFIGIDAAEVHNDFVVFSGCFIHSDLSSVT
jgi:hypothetical protein